MSHTYTVKRQVHVDTVARVEVYDNNVVFLRGTNHRVLFKATFEDQHKAFTFADLVESYRSHRVPAR